MAAAAQCARDRRPLGPGLIAESVGRDRFVHDAREIMDALMATQQSIGRDHPQAECLVEVGGRRPAAARSTRMPTCRPPAPQACVHVCRCMGADFVPYMRFLLPPLVASLGREVELSVSDAEEEEVARGGQHEQGVSTTFVAYARAVRRGRPARSSRLLPRAGSAAWASRSSR